MQGIFCNFFASSLQVLELDIPNDCFVRVSCHYVTYMKSFEFSIV